MPRVRALVEGQTEEAFVREVLAPELGACNIYITATMVGKRRHRGGVRPWGVTRRDILAALRQDPEVHCTTMFDYYGLPDDWPEREPSQIESGVSNKAGRIEQGMLADVCGVLGASFDAGRFVPYIQMHEFEALLFSDTGALARSIEIPSFQSQLDQVVAECGEPEAIDDRPETAPSRRIVARVPRYQKVFHGIIAARRIGLARMRERCPHFAQWVATLERLGEAKR